MVVFRSSLSPPFAVLDFFREYSAEHFKVASWGSSTGVAGRVEFHDESVIAHVATNPSLKLSKRARLTADKHSFRESPNFSAWYSK